MINSLRRECERVLRIPPDPAAPAGHDANAQVFRASPKYYRYLLVIWALRSLASMAGVAWILIAPTLAAVTLDRHGHRAGLWLLLIPALGLPLVAGLRLFALAVLRLDFEKRWYVVTDRSLRVREGIFVVREMTVTFANIQNLSIAQGPIQRALGIADLRVETAGGGGMQNTRHPGLDLHTAWFRGIDNAGAVRELIQRRLRETKDSDLGDHEEVDSSSWAAPRARPGEAAPVALSSERVAALRAVLAEAAALRAAISGSTGGRG